MKELKSLSGRLQRLRDTPRGRGKVKKLFKEIKILTDEEMKQLEDLLRKDLEPKVVFSGEEGLI